jgi:hypothetical protein
VRHDLERREDLGVGGGVVDHGDLGSRSPLAGEDGRRRRSDEGLIGVHPSQRGDTLSPA